MAKRGTRADDKARERQADDRAEHGQSRALGDTGDGQTGVGPTHEGISNRPGDRATNDTRTDQPSDVPNTDPDDADRPPTEAGVPPPQRQQRPRSTPRHGRAARTM
jgi:hypothetical protein